MYVSSTITLEHGTLIAYDTGMNTVGGKTFLEEGLRRGRHLKIIENDCYYCTVCNFQSR